MQALMAEKLFLASRATFGSEKPGWFRIVFTQPRELVLEGLARMLQSH
jgi:1-aminocyclopropane-1-carboxylate synthase